MSQAKLCPFALTLGLLFAAVPTSAPAQASGGTLSPITAFDGNGQRYDLPGALPSDPCFLFFAFSPKGQADAAGYLKVARPLAQSDFKWQTFEVDVTGPSGAPRPRAFGLFGRQAQAGFGPVAPGDPVPGAGSLRVSAPDKAAVQAAVGARSQDSVTGLLVRRNGQVLWRSDGPLPASREPARDFMNQIRKATGGPTLPYHNLAAEQGRAPSPSAAPAPYGMAQPTPTKKPRPKASYTPKPKPEDDPRLATGRDE